MGREDGNDWWNPLSEYWQLYNWDDEKPWNFEQQRYCHIQPGDTFKDGRYVAQKQLGWGSAATVWLAWDTLSSQYVALKVSNRRATIVSELEIDTLQKLANGDQQNQRCVVKILDHFEHTTKRCNHVCLVLEYLGENLIKLIGLYGPNGLPLRLVKHICLDILDGLDYLHTELSLLHGNIKPENICLLSPIDPSDDPRKSGVSPILPPKKSNDKEETSKIAESCTISLGQLVLSHDVESRKSHDNLMGNADVNSVAESSKSHDNFMGNADVNSVAKSSKSLDDLMGNPDVNSVAESSKSHGDLVGNADVNSIAESSKIHGVLFGNPDVNSVESLKSHDDLMGNPDVNSVAESLKSHGDLVGNRNVNSVESSKSHDVLLGNRDVNSVESRKKELLESLDQRCKLIDFGEVWTPGDGDRHSVMARLYRPPEVILEDGPSISTSADLWSFACVCFELVTGEYLFPAEPGDGYCRDQDHLALMKQQLERIPRAMIARSRPWYSEWFDKKGRLKNVPTRKRETIKERLVVDHNFSEKDATELSDFLNWILKHEPTKRPTAARCRRHKWFDDVRNVHSNYTSKERRPGEETKLKNVKVVEDGLLISKSKESGAGEGTKLKNVNVVEDAHFTWKRKENGARARSKLRNANAVEAECFTCKSKGNGEYKCKREKRVTKKKNVCGGGRSKKAAVHCRDRRPSSTRPF